MSTVFTLGAQGIIGEDVFRRLCSSYTNLNLHKYPELGLHCLHVSPKGVSGLKRANIVSHDCKFVVSSEIRATLERNAPEKRK